MMNLLLLGLLLASPAPWPTEGLAGGDAGSRGDELRCARRALREFASGKHGYVDGMLVIRNGKVVYEKSYDRAKDYARLFGGKGEPGIYNYYDPDWHPYYKGHGRSTRCSRSARA